MRWVIKRRQKQVTSLADMPCVAVPLLTARSTAHLASRYAYDVWNCGIPYRVCSRVASSDAEWHSRHLRILIHSKLATVENLRAVSSAYGSEQSSRLIIIAKMRYSERSDCSGMGY